MKTLITVHATNTGPGLHLTGKDIDRRDRQHGYSRCGYHFVITREGDVYEGRKLSEASIHDEEDAKPAVSICLVGGCDDHGNPEDSFTLRQWEALKVVVRAVGETHTLTSVRSKTPAVTTERVNQILWRPND